MEMFHWLSFILGFSVGLALCASVIGVLLLKDIWETCKWNKGS